MKANERQHSLDDVGGLASHLLEVGQLRAVYRDRNSRNRRDREIAKAHVLCDSGEERLDHAGAKSVTEDDAVDVAFAEKSRGGFDAERADQARALADGDREIWIRTPASEHQYGRVLEWIGGRQDRHVLNFRSECLRAP